MGGLRMSRVNNFFAKICVAVWRENCNFVVGLAATGGKVA
jgi:hypothetical protein